MTPPAQEQRLRQQKRTETVTRVTRNRGSKNNEKPLHEQMRGPQQTTTATTTTPTTEDNTDSTGPTHHTGETGQLNGHRKRLQRCLYHCNLREDGTCKTNSCLGAFQRFGGYKQLQTSRTSAPEPNAMRRNATRDPTRDAIPDATRDTARQRAAARHTTGRDATRRATSHATRHGATRRDTGAMRHATHDTTRRDAMPSDTTRDIRCDATRGAMQRAEGERKVILILFCFAKLFGK